MSGKNFFQIDPENRPNQTTRERVVSERGRKELPPGTKGGENLKPDRHYEHKQHAFDSYCKKVLKYEAYNGYREISRRQKCEALFSELSEEELAQLAVYDRYSWEYTTFPVGGAVILIEDDRLAEALNAGRIAGAALDVFVPEPLPRDHFLWETKNLLITPHVAGNMSLGYTRDKDVDMFCEDLENFAAGRPLAHLVNRKLGY